jgi:hypothetical protein
MYARNQNFGVKVEHDNFGRVRRVGNVFINYDANDRIKRAPSTWLITVSFGTGRGLQIIYNPVVIVDIVGSVNGFQDFELSKLTAMTMTTSMETHEAAIMRLLVTKRLQAIRISTISKIAAQKRKLMILKLQEV